MDFMKKYIHIAKAIKPQLTEQASEIIAQEYTKLRDFDLEQSDVARVSQDLHLLLYYFSNLQSLPDPTRHCSYPGDADPSVHCPRPSPSLDYD